MLLLFVSENFMKCIATRQSTWIAPELLSSLLPLFQLWRYEVSRVNLAISRTEQSGKSECDTYWLGGLNVVHNIIRVGVEVVWTPVFEEVKESLIPFCFYFRNSETTHSKHMAGKEKKNVQNTTKQLHGFVFCALIILRYTSEDTSGLQSN